MKISNSELQSSKQLNNELLGGHNTQVTNYERFNSILKSEYNKGNIQIDVTNNLISGQTYNIKDILKSYFNCTWNAENKAWNIPQSAYADIKNVFGVEIAIVSYEAEKIEYTMSDEDKKFFGL